MISSDAVVEQAKKYSPLAAVWWVALVQGLVIGGLGLYLILDPVGAKQNFAKAIALYLFATGLVTTTRLQMQPRAGATQIAYYRALLAAIVGAVCVVLLVFNLITSASVLTSVVWVTGLAVLVYGLTGLYLAFTVEKRGSGRLLGIIGSIIFIAVGFSTLFLQGRNVVDGWIGPTLIVLGIALIAFAFYRRSQIKQTEEAFAGVADAQP